MSRITPNTLPPVLDAESICFSRGGQPVISDISPDIALRNRHRHQWPEWCGEINASSLTERLLSL